MLVATEPVKSLGRIPYGKPHHFTFELVNNGDNFLEITKLVVGCTSCTKAHTKKTVLYPGETSIVEATFTPGSLGSQNKYINVEWNKTNLIKLNFTADSYA